MIEADGAEQHRQVFLERRLAEMGVHRMRAVKELAEVFRADRDHQRQADGRPDRVAAADPVPEAEDALAVDAEGGDLVERRRNGGEVVLHGGFAERIGDELARRLGVGHRFDRRKRLRCDDEQRRFRLNELQDVGDVCAVDIGDEMRARAVMEGGERERRHDRTEIGAADADIDDVGDRLAGRALQRAGADTVGKFAHGGQHAVDVRHHILAVDEYWRVGAVAQRGVQHGAVFGEVDGNAREHFLALGSNAALGCELLEKGENVVVHRRLRVIHQQVVERGAEPGKAFGIGGEGSANIRGLRCRCGALQLIDEGVHGRLLAVRVAGCQT
ncbi:hypothetical protein RHSP_70222 [Rhizobium freirei PRF 81]|uniref:Uncharacterized protein n=1 Tax=Rhizobium freirei PRF 81 TaxID=363754 RepID=N6UT48_9HYPH|nr:hypothetical protein RHSP_70222 [Rhizobium freirei PRF 81]